ncbi:uncharacterized protein [Aegilops tauschii subsp. strangulata]|uniref:uncharacterized protein n=1 Tax=Aegilops tauschii subsp. strangulata TaxID=200361 RepID=UPI003CC84D83
MARTLMCVPPRTQPAERWLGRRILVMSLLTHNPTSTVEQGVALATIQSFAVRREEATAGAPKRMRSRRVALDLPEEIVVWEIFVRLPAKEILRCRAVCRSWRGLTSAADFIVAHHRRQPSLPLVVLNGTPTTEDGLSISKHSRPVLGFHDYIGFQLHASCDGLLLLTTSSDGRFSICNPATRQCASLPGLPNSSVINIAALYLRCPSREYRVLYWELGHQATYYILMVGRRGSPRCIGVPSDTPAIEKAMLATRTIYPTNLAPPIKFRSCLHWDHAWVHHDAGIVVFNTVTESFRFMRRPAGATSFCTCLSDMEDSIGFSCFDDGRTVARIWVLRAYGTSQIQNMWFCPMRQMC